MEQKYDLSEHLDELDLVVDSLFAALRQFLRISDEAVKGQAFYPANFAEEQWHNIPNNIRACILELIYVTYTDAPEVSPDLKQWRQDIYAELDEVATRPPHLRKVK